MINIIDASPPGDGYIHSSKYSKIYEKLMEAEFLSWFCIGIPRNEVDTRNLISSMRTFAKKNKFNVKTKIQKDKSSLQIYVMKVRI